MARKTLLSVICILVSLLRKPSTCETIQSDFTIKVDGNKVNLQIIRGENVVLDANLGLDLPSGLKDPTDCSETGFCKQWGSLAQLQVFADGEFCHDLEWTTSALKSLKDCIAINDEAQWFGGPEEYYQRFPMNKQAKRESVPYLPGDMLQSKEMYFGGVAEPYWLTSDGVAIWVPEGVPLFYSWNSEQNPNEMCLSAQDIAPYETLQVKRLKYKICSMDNARDMHLQAVNSFLGKPSGIPDEIMMKDPIWSSWAQYKANINQSTILDFVQTIHDNGFAVSQIEIDDNWEVCYGDAVFDVGENKFPNVEKMIDTIKNEFGYRVTLWIHPFVNLECPSWQTVAVPPQSFFVRDKKGKEGIGNLPGLVWWWQGVLASYVDFTNPEAVSWWSSRLEHLRQEYGIDSFKFDAGESNWLPSSILLNDKVDKSTWPAAFTTAYVDAVSKFGPMIEVRVGRRTQTYPIFVRMLDKDSNWGFDNGLKTLVTTLLQTSMVGYPFVLPDMIGGNGYGDDPLDESNIPSRELYLRWLQANVFMPGMQFSFVPWIYDDDVIEHTKFMISIREKYSERIVELAKAAALTGEPINRPVWWIDPYDKEALSIEDGKPFQKNFQCRHAVKIPFFSQNIC